MKITRKIKATITMAISFMVFMLIMVACDRGYGTMHGSGSMGMSGYNWGQILFGLVLGLTLGFIIGMIVFKRK